MRKKQKILAVFVVIFGLLILTYSGILTGMVISDTLTKDTAPRYLFYHNLRAEINLEYKETCYPSGEVMTVTQDNQCCPGLDTLSITDESQKDCTPLSGIALCSNCGNGKCEYGENKCNCQADCKK